MSCCLGLRLLQPLLQFSHLASQGSFLGSCSSSCCVTGSGLKLTAKLVDIQSQSSECQVRVRSGSSLELSLPQLLLQLQGVLPVDMLGVCKSGLGLVQRDFQIQNLGLEGLDGVLCSLQHHQRQLQHLTQLLMQLGCMMDNLMMA